MDTYNRDVAIIGSAVYGGILVIGMLLFALGRSGEPFYRHPSPNVAIFSVFWFAFSPSLLFIGATVPWVCALCESRAAALTFAVVPGGLFVLVGAVWILLNDKYENFYTTFEVPRTSPWSRNTVNVNGAAPYRVDADAAAEHFPSPAAVIEMMNREAGAYPTGPPSSRWGTPGGYGGPADFTHFATTAPPFAGNGWPGYGPGYVPAGAAAPYYPGYGPNFPVPTQQYSGSAATNVNAAGGGVGMWRDPQSVYRHSPSPLPVQPASRELQRPPGSYYIA